MKNLSWANFALGLWLIMAPFALLYRGMQNALWEDMIVGFLIAVFSLWQASGELDRGSLRALGFNFSLCAAI